tara:strand:+ start:330 stop:527 length:198 start_codon:yes stop_codon:yes gene_type:complete
VNDFNWKIFWTGVRLPAPPPTLKGVNMLSDALLMSVGFLIGLLVEKKTKLADKILAKTTKLLTKK